MELEQGQWQSGDEYGSLREAIEYLTGLETDGCNGLVYLSIGHDPAQCPVHDA